MTPVDPIEWHVESATTVRAEVPDPEDPNCRYVLQVLSTSSGASASWFIWGSRVGVHVSNSASSREVAKRRAEFVLRAIVDPLIVCPGCVRPTAPIATAIATCDVCGAEVSI